jgi:hypothetical protein
MDFIVGDIFLKFVHVAFLIHLTNEQVMIIQKVGCLFRQPLIFLIGDVAEWIRHVRIFSENAGHALS